MVTAYILVTLLAGPKLADSLGAEVMWTCLAAAATLILVLLLAPYSLRWRGLGESFKEPWVCRALCWLGVAALLGLLMNAIAIWLGIHELGGIPGFAGAASESSGGGIFGDEAKIEGLLGFAGSTSWAVPGEDGGSAQLPLYARVLLLVGCCFSTAVFEEGFFRGIVVPCASRRTQMELDALRQGDVGIIARETYNQMTSEEQREASNVPYSAAVFSGLLFGVVHIFSGAPSFDGAGLFGILLMAAQGLAKAVQAGMFGYVMAAFMLRSGSVFGPMVVHFLFDLLYFAPIVLATGSLPTAYMTGSLFDLLLLAVTIAALVPAMRAASSWLKEQNSDILPSHE